MRLLISGATGFVGRALVAHLRELPKRPGIEPIEPILLVRQPTAISTRSDDGAASGSLPQLTADLRDRSAVDAAIADARPDAVLHLAAAGVTDPNLPLDAALAHNVQGTLNLVQACFSDDSSVSRLVVARTPGEMTSMNMYAASKAAAWQFCQMYARTRGWPIVGAMVYQAYGADQPPHTLIPSAFRSALAGSDFPMTAGGQRRDWIHVSDVVKGLLAVLSSKMPPGSTADIGTGKMTSVAEVVALIYSLTGSPGKPLIGAVPSRVGETAEQVANAERSYERLGWRAEVSLEEGLRQMSQQFHTP